MGTGDYSYLSSCNSFIRSCISAVLSCSSGNVTPDFSEVVFAAEAGFAAEEAFAASPDLARALPIQSTK